MIECLQREDVRANREKGEDGKKDACGTNRERSRGRAKHTTNPRTHNKRTVRRDAVSGVPHARKSRGGHAGGE